MKQELTIMQKAIMTAIKKNNSERELEWFNKGIKFMSMGRYIKEGYQEHVITGFNNTVNGEYASLTRYEVKCTFKPADKWEDNIVKYQVNIYSDGTMGIYFDGTEWKK